MRRLRGIGRAMLFVIFSDRVIKYHYDDPVGVGCYAWIELKGYGTIAFEDYDGKYRFTW